YGEWPHTGHSYPSGFFPQKNHWSFSPPQTAMQYPGKQQKYILRTDSESNILMWLIRQSQVTVSVNQSAGP
ncbi:hypothetical protein, partial [Escherichia coli]|uniref:hypothetical protein n=1 Tax=Escherichia coli TaxID=562 RepID=UPI001BA4F9F6